MTALISPLISISLITDILSDLVGLIAARNLALADFFSEGTTHPDYILLAALHSNAVDYCETGSAVEYKQLSKAPPIKPDFMQPDPSGDESLKESADFYPSQKLLVFYIALYLQSKSQHRCLYSETGGSIPVTN